MLLSDKRGYYFEAFETVSAFKFYEAVRSRLPSANFPKSSRHVSGLLEICDHCDVFVFDAFGVLNVGNVAIAGAAECVSALRERGKQVFIITNAATFAKPRTILKFHNLGFDFSDEEIVTSRMAAENAISQRNVPLWGIMSKADFEPQDLSVNSVLLTDDPQTYDRVDGFLFLSTWEWTSRHQMILENALEKRPRPVVVANPDVIAPLEERFSTEPGFVAHRIADLLRVNIEFHGKPFPSVFELVEQKLPIGIDRKRICMIGDTLHTDVLGGASRGWSTVLVSGHGLFRGHDPMAFIDISGIIPDWIVPSI